MKHIIRLGLLSIAMVLSIVGNSVPVMAVGEEPKHLIIAEVSTESETSAGEEYIELFNPNTVDVDATGWQLQYRSYSHTNNDIGSWTTRAILGCASTKASDCTVPKPAMIGAGDTLRLSSFEAGDGVLWLEPGMSTSGGEVRLVQPGSTQAANIVHDMVGYGSAKGFEGVTPAPAPKPGQSIIRTQDATNAFVDTDQNGADFTLTLPENANDPQPPTSTTDNGQDSQPQPSDSDITPKTYLDAEITEVMPDPASPQTDSADEFIEIYNPYADTLDLTGYVLKTGTDWSHKYVIDNVTVESYGYVPLMSAQTHLSLSNSGSGVQLYDPNGKLLFEVPSYSTAKTGDSWVRDANGQWVWTVKPTPGEPNIVDLPATGATTATKTATSGTTKKSTAKTTATSTKKASTPKTTSGAVKGISTTASQPATANTGNQTGLWVMAGAAVLGTGYALFEYRQDIGGFIRRRWQALRIFGREK